MGTLQSGIELYDGFSAPLYSMINALNLTVSAFEDMQRISGNQIDTSSIDGARAAADEATRAFQIMQNALSRAGSAGGGGTGPNIPPADAQIVWKPDTLDVFTNSGIDRFEQEIQSANSMLERLGATQTSITQQAQAINILPPEAITDIQNLQNRVQDLQAAIIQVEQNSLDVGSDEANAQLEHLRTQLAQTLAYQENLNAAMRGMNVGDINSAFLRLSQSVGNVERSIRDGFSRPIDIPITWSTQGIEVFTNTGVERFQQEIQSATNMVNTLNQAQQRISAQAAAANIFPPNAVTDLNNMQNRIQALQTRITQIASNPINMGSDTANRELEQLRAQLDQAIAAQQALNGAVENMDVQAANDAYNRLAQIIGGTERNIRDNVDEQGRFNREISQGTNDANQLMRTIKGAVGAYATLHSVSAALNLSDQLASTTARLNLMNDGLQTTQDLQNMIYLSAERSRGSYQATANAVSKLGLMAGDAFGSSEEIIAFMEQVNKQFRIAGTETAGIDAAMLQLTQAMGSGVLRGEEYNSILEQAPNIIQAIADYMEVPKGQLKDMAAEGQITADIVKAAMFAAADETNAKFESMPQTFSQIGTSFQNTALMAFQPVLAQMNEIANGDAFQGFVNGGIEALSVVAGVALEIFDLMIGIAQVTGDNWSWLGPIVYGVAAALAAYVAVLTIYNTVQAISNGIKAAAAIQANIYAAAEMMETGATFAATAAQHGLNAALLACPITWIILAIIALIAVFYAAVAAVNKFAGTSVSATGIICGIFTTGAAFVGNLFVTLINFVIDIFVVLWNFIAAFANFFGNVFNDPVGAIARLFFDLVDTVLSLLQTLASAIDTLFGSDLSGAVQGWRDSLSGWVDDTFGQGEEIMATLNSEDMHLGRFEYGDAWNAGYQFGEGIEDTISDFDFSSLFDSNIPGAEDYADLSNYGNGLTSDVSDIAGNTGSIAESLDVTDEELKYLRDIAERDTVNRFTIAEVAVDMGGITNQVNGPADLDGLVDSMVDGVNEAIDIVTEGVHT